jgi:hypothetical protein
VVSSETVLLAGPIHDLADLLAGQQRQRVDEDEPADAVAAELGRLDDHHAAGAGADQDDLLEVLEEQELRDLLAMGGVRDAGTHRIVTLGAAVERRRVDRVPGGAQPLRDGLPDPASLVRAVDQDVGGHCGAAAQS